MSQVVIDYAPRAYFIPYHERTQRFSCIVAHRRAGKTTACINDAQRSAIIVPRTRPRVAYIAPYLKQAKAIAWDILRASAQPLIEHGAKINESELRVDYPNGGQVRIYGADNPDALRGIYLDHAILDEPAQIDPRLWPEIIRPALTDRNGRADFIGTPKGRDAFYQTWRVALANPHEWLALKLASSETGVIDPSELEAARAIMSESQFAREFECSFDEPDVDQFIASSLVDLAKARGGKGTGPRVLGVDVARHGDDRTVALFRDGDLVRAGDIRSWRGLDTMQTAARVAALIEEYKPDAVFIDGVGVGGGVVDRLRQMQHRVIEVNAGATAGDDTRYFNLRAEMWGKMRDWLKDRGSIPNDDALADDLTAPSYSYDHRNRVKLERKEEMKARGLPSPDVGDALAMTFAQPIASKDMRLDLAWAATVDGADDDPLGEWR